MRIWASPIRYVVESGSSNGFTRSTNDSVAPLPDRSTPLSSTGMSARIADESTAGAAKESTGAVATAAESRGVPVAAESTAAPAPAAAESGSCPRDAEAASRIRAVSVRNA